jgi:transposase
MESTGVYWIHLYQILETRGFQVFLVNAQHIKNVPGRKSDVSDCQWIQYLHSVGLLKASFRPPDEICVIRSLWRLRASAVLRFWMQFWLANEIRRSSQACATGV